MSQILNFWEGTGGIEGDEREREKKESETEMGGVRTCSTTMPTRRVVEKVRVILAPKKTSSDPTYNLASRGVENLEENVLLRLGLNP